MSAAAAALHVMFKVGKLASLVGHATRNNIQIVLSFTDLCHWVDGLDVKHPKQQHAGMQRVQHLYLHKCTRSTYHSLCAMHFQSDTLDKPWNLSDTGSATGHTRRGF